MRRVPGLTCESAPGCARPVDRIAGAAAPRDRSRFAGRGAGLRRKFFGLNAQRAQKSSKPAAPLAGCQNQISAGVQGVEDRARAIHFPAHGIERRRGDRPEGAAPRRAVRPAAGRRSRAPVPPPPPGYAERSCPPIPHRQTPAATPKYPGKWVRSTFPVVVGNSR